MVLNFCKKFKPCNRLQIADSIVHKARETLERAIELVHANYPKWQARVVYGDTDSMFIALEKGTNRKKAFRVAREIVDAVTKSNPRPVKLKFEKVALLINIRNYCLEIACNRELVSTSLILDQRFLINGNLAWQFTWEIFCCFSVLDCLTN